MPPLAPCGTPAAYRRHLRHDQEPCWACQVAHAQETHDLKAAPKRRQVLLEALAGFDKYPVGQRPQVVISVYPTVSRDARLALGNDLEWDGTPTYEWQREMRDTAGLDPWGDAA